jgi:hypothetical protein
VLSQITLPGPVAEIVTVLIDGEPLDPAAYRVDNRRWLVRTDGARWPMEACDGNRMTVTYVQGTPVPAGGQYAHGMLLCELAKACIGKPCQLPRAATSVSRQGVTVTFPDMNALIREAATGIFEVDLWVATNQPTMPRTGRVMSPDVKEVRWQSWP